MLKLFLNVSGLHIKDFLALSINFHLVPHGVLLFLISAVLLFLILIFYKKIRKKFHVKVNCWFCNTNATVPYDLSNSWDCPHCLQYNGFNKMGDYNKVIHQHYDSKLNENKFSNFKKSLNTKCDINKVQSNGFCKLCNINQQLKIQQLALFVPINENNYFEEIEQYRQKLEKAYKLCSKCEVTLKDTLKKQECSLLKNRLNNSKNENHVKKSDISFVFHIKKFLPNSNAVTITLKWTSIILATLLFIALFHKLETENLIRFLKLPDLIFLEPLYHFLRIIIDYSNKIYAVRKELSVLGFICCLMNIFKHHNKINQINLLMWGLLHILLWSNLTEVQIFNAGILVFFNYQSIKNKSIYIKKKPLPKKFSFKFQEQISQKIFDMSSDKIIENDHFTSSPIKQDKTIENTSSLNDLKEIQQQQENHIGQNFHIYNKDRKSNENEVELLANEEKDNQSISNNLTNSDSNILNSTFNKKFLSTPEIIKKDIGNNSMDEFSHLYNNLNDLHLGGKNKKLNKPSNFLFVNHNSFEKKCMSPIIKPSKLTKSVNNSWILPELSESASRSSTPSSGYSSQKTERIEGNRYDFVKSGNPMNFFRRQTHQNRFNYWDGNNGFYGNLNGFSPGFVPFQQFPGSIGHTTIYTCSRPTDFPFPCHWQGFPPQKLSPTSSRISDISDSENLFQNTSRSFENSKKWFKFKRFSYYFSISLNIITLFGLIYLISLEIVSVEWNLPKLNFFV